MIARAAMFLKFREGKINVDIDKFYRYWLEEHGPLDKKHANELKIKKYIQCHIIQYNKKMPLNKMFQRTLHDEYDSVDF